MKVLVLGSGQMGKGLAYDLVKQDSVEQIILQTLTRRARNLSPRKLATELLLKLSMRRNAISL